MIKVIEIKTPNCIKCKTIQPKLDALKAKYANVQFIETLYPDDSLAEELFNKFRLRCAPSFIIDKDGGQEQVEFAEIEGKIKHV
ncbi:MAG: thioredoxin family protein [Rickettsiales bacterium]|jgi:thiol-disulfide isomerase/thioredoxin|nr:thioredoxin family protein [Rickettsiales bacterium]